MTDHRVWKLPESAPDPAELAAAWTRVVENGLRAMQSARPGAASFAFDPTAPARAMFDFTTQLWSNPAAILEASQAAASEWAELWSAAARRAAGQGVEPVIQPERGDRRFGDPAWSEDPVFDYLKQAYLLASRQAADLVAHAEGIDPDTRTRAEFFTTAYLNALSPANFAFTNPEAIRRAIDTGSISLLSGLANLLADAATDARLPVRRASAGFELGKDIAVTPGSVVFQNELMQLIQYAPTTETVHRRPLLYVPPLVNKYYLLDLQPRSSLIRWLVEQGHTLFVISWVNPGPGLAGKGLGAYLDEGPLAALDYVAGATGEREVDLFGFCMGGTLAAMAASKNNRLEKRDCPSLKNRDSPSFSSLTTIGSMFDFSNMGQWATFTEPAQLAAMEKHLEAKGVLAAHELQALFSLVRANDLIWSSVVSHYLLDKEAPPSDILHWFADGAHIPAAFLRDWTGRILRDNELTRPGALDIGAPAMVISLKDDHVSAWQATYDGARLLGGETRFLLGGSGHNAGVINPPAANKHGYWTNEGMPPTAEQWLETATRHEGSWWPEWQAWLVRDGGERVKARRPKKEIEPAPGSYVRMR